MNITGNSYGMKNWGVEKKLKYSLKFHQELHYLYSMVTKLVSVCLEKGTPLIIENPHSAQHYLTRYWCIKPKIIDSDRRRDGDYYKKPTQYWFIGCEPKNNIIFEPIGYVEQKTISKERNQVKRSLIHPQYANRFLRQYVLDEQRGDYVRTN